MNRIDGSRHSGSGTIVRFAVAMSAVSGEAVCIRRVRANRPTPGLRPQHVTAIRATAQLCDAQTQGLRVGSGELTFAPGRGIRGGEYSWDIGTAGSTTMLALSVLPLACFAEGPIRARITGGVFQDFAPSPHHMQNVLLPLVSRMGAEAELELRRAGYVPKGSGEIELRTKPARKGLRSLSAIEPGEISRVTGVAFASHLAEQRVGQRMARSCEEMLKEAGIRAEIDCVDDTLALQRGASLAIWGESSTGCLLGADRAGAKRRRSETIGRTVARYLLEDLESGATVDRHLADQLVFFASLATGATEYVAPDVTEHLVTNLWLSEQSGARVERAGKRVRIEGLGRKRSF